MNNIKENVKRILEEVPENVIVIAATKGRSVEEIKEAIDAGIKVIGENYVQEAEGKFKEIGRTVNWHLIGNLQTNKVKKALNIFDCIETVDSFGLAKEIDKYAGKKGIIFPVFIEINSGREPQKSGVFPEDTEKFIIELSELKNIKIEGLMTMGPLVDNPEDIRHYFRLTKELFDKIKEKKLPNVKMEYLSMGMSDTYKVAIEEGANIIRIGSIIFGYRR
ncbi:MAG: YggS family pyridoxal phosphate-dependent enzyme [Candidatus Omnitrophica bacterium]|nr:YggS family pyridoxal phosphate-dependent enzyme [Candidatus Omnitrophota bacterium]MCM8777987.1 YggS family pyridoxal phosphate-dependent enzyme [Candidatus Omnitrophota bacterium]